MEEKKIQNGMGDNVLTEEEQKKANRKKKIKRITRTFFTATIIFLFSLAGYHFINSNKNTEIEPGEIEFPEIELSKLPRISPEIQEIIENRTGETLTAEYLGRKIGVSSREVNRRLIEKGLAKRIGDGIYPTEAGEGLCTFIDKTTRAGYSFRGIEWDKKVAELIFTPEEISNELLRKERIKKLVEEMDI